MTLEDDYRLFSPYEIAPLVREDALERFPQLEQASTKLVECGTPDRRLLCLVRDGQVVRQQTFPV